METLFVKLDTKKCEACWKCLESCPINVIGKIDLPWHKHAVLNHPDDCSGCLTCIKECTSGAITKIQVPMKKAKADTKVLSLIINLSLVVAATAMVFSGFLLQIKYHMGQHEGIGHSMEYLGLNYYCWSDFHKISIVVFSLLIGFHTFLHLNWYKTLIRKNLPAKKKQVIILTVLFFLVAVTGYLSWIIHLTNGSEMTRNFFIELHDKLTLFLFVFLLLHISKKINWFIRAIASVTKKENN
jgi:NAD-dependent dihydropyrimidine dehydrogenase PreA subunit